MYCSTLRNCNTMQTGARMLLVSLCTLEEKETVSKVSSLPNNQRLQKA